jgi:hypothetical protein
MTPLSSNDLANAIEIGLGLKQFDQPAQIYGFAVTCPLFAPPFVSSLAR